MKNLKKGLLVLCAGLICLSGCGEKKQEETKEEKIKIVENEVYTAPSNPNNDQAKLYNQLSKALEDGDDEETLAKLVAKNFAFDFLTLANKKDGEDIGGLTYIPENYREEFAQFAKSNYYNSYATIVKQYDKDALPQMTSLKVEKVTPSTLYVKDVSGEGYMIDLQAKYKHTELGNDALKTKMTVQVMRSADGRLEVIALQ